MRHFSQDALQFFIRKLSRSSKLCSEYAGLILLVYFDTLRVLGHCVLLAYGSGADEAEMCQSINTVVLKLLEWRPSKKNCEEAETQCVTGEAICESVASQKICWLTSLRFFIFRGIIM